MKIEKVKECAQKSVAPLFMEVLGGRKVEGGRVDEER